MPLTRPGVFPTYGVHNPPEYSPCASPDCLYDREPGEPSDPLLPPFWTARWTMYRVFQNYENVLPPYDGRPPAPLVEGRDYQASHGFTCYDSTWRGPDGEVGAMMEHYEGWSLPIFQMDNHFTSSFISLGDNAYFITYDEDRPRGLEPICTFSDLNHPPTRDFIKHLPYSSTDSAQLDGRIQGYSFWTNPDSTKPPIQVGASPDRTQEGAILFGYAFDGEWTPDAVDPHAAPYRHPHSFYFSGFPGSPPDAPIVSQHFDSFAMQRPDPAHTWDLVARLSGGAPPPACQLFASAGAADHPTWEGHTRSGGDD